jgi:ribosomal protein S8E
VKDLNELLERMSNVLNKKDRAKEVVIFTVKKHTNITLKAECVFIKESVIEIEASPAVKSEIALKINLILKDLKEVEGIHIPRILYK